MDFEQWEKATWRLLENRSPTEADRDYTHAEVRIVMEAAIQTLIVELMNGGGLSLSNLGRLYVVTRRGRTVVSHINGESKVYDVSERQAVCFRPSQVLIKWINQIY